MGFLLVTPFRNLSVLLGPPSMLREEMIWTGCLLFIIIPPWMNGQVVNQKKGTAKREDRRVDRAQGGNNGLGQRVIKNQICSSD